MIDKGLAKSWLALGILAAGCAGSSGSDTNLFGNPNFSGLTVQMVSPRSLQDTSLRYFVSAVNQDGVSVTEEVSVDSPLSQVEAFIAQIPAGPVRILVRVETLDGEVIATREQEFDVDPTRAGRVQVTSYFLPGQTREIGLLSLGSNGAQADGDSVSPVISADGRFVAFASNASLVAGSTGVQQILLRDRALGVLSRVSLNTTNNPVSTDCFEPDMDSTAENIVFRAGTVNQQGSIFVRLRPQATTKFFQPGRKPRISADGSFIVFEFIDVNTGRQSVQLRSVRGSTSELISRNAASAVANADSSKPCISGDGRFVVFASQATDLIPGGSPGIYLLDRGNSTFQRLPIAANLEDTSITPDGKFILASAPGQVPVLFDRELASVTPLPAIVGLVGRPSMSGNANLISFFSSSPNLINNDLNGKTDCFVLNRTLATIDRVNISNDGTAVAGGVDETTPLTGPALSSNGKRIAFSSRDRRLVPANSNLLFDIYSSAVPTRGLLYAVSADRIFRFNNLSTADGPQQPALSGFSAALRGPIDTFLDAGNDRLYVVNGSAAGVQAKGILVYNQASLLNGTNLEPSRQITGPGLDQGLRNVTVDTSRDILYVGDGTRIIAIPNASTVNGEVPLSSQRRFQFAAFGHGSMLLDTRRDEMYVISDDPNTVGRFVGVVKASSASGTPPILRQLFGTAFDMKLPFRLAFDTSPGATSGGNTFNDSRLIVGLVNSGGNQLSTFNSNGSFTGFLGNTAASSVTPVSSLADVLFDPYTNLRYVGGTDSALRVFRSSAGTVNPDRTLTSLTSVFPVNPAFGIHYAIDRQHDVRLGLP
ncbi:MAG: hypothetical protein U0931_22235 [Vulcanimicrobiota bacterium]